MHDPTLAAHSKPSSTVVLVAGVVTSVLALVGVFLLGALTEDFYVMGWYVYFVIPVGAILVGVAASSGYGMASWARGVRIDKSLLMTILALQVVAYFASQYVEFYTLDLHFEDGEPMGFLYYFDWSARSFAWVDDDGKMGRAMGVWGYGFRLLEIAGFAGGSLVAPLALRGKAYCERCSRYMKGRGQVLVPASVPVRKIRKKDQEAQEAYEAEQQQAYQGGFEEVARLRDLAVAGDFHAFRQAIGPQLESKKATGKLPARIQLSLSSCPSCEVGELAVTLLTGQGQNQDIALVSSDPLPAHFASQALD